MARFFLERSVETRSAATVGFLVVSVAIGNRILNGATYSFPDPFGGHSISVAGQGVPLATIVELLLAFGLAAGVSLGLQRTFLGAQLRAMSERATTAQLLGVRVGMLTIVVWAFACAISTLALVFVLPTSTTSFPPLAYLIVPATAAALLGLLQNMYLAALGGLLVGIAESLVLTTSLGRYADAVPFLIVVAVMTYWRRKDVWSEAR
jgi:branched-chain amino acid transport system permease protein